MDITWTTKAYGWEGILLRNNKVVNDLTRPRQERHAADKASQKIVAQLLDTTLMGLRGQLIRATSAGDEPAIIKITKQIRDYNGEDLETGLYE